MKKAQRSKSLVPLEKDDMPNLKAGNDEKEA
jgi:hypothetical protein